MIITPFVGRVDNSGCIDNCLKPSMGVQKFCVHFTDVIHIPEQSVGKFIEVLAPIGNRFKVMLPQTKQKKLGGNSVELFLYSKKETDPN